jgi:chromate transporter
VFRDTIPVHAFPLSFDAPKLSTIDPWTLVLSIAAAVAIFRFKVGMIPTLAGCCCAAGIVLFFVGVLP